MASLSTPLIDLGHLLAAFSKEMITKIAKGSETTISIYNFTNLRLLVAGGARTNKRDREREALSCLINPTRSYYDLMLSDLVGDGAYLFRQLCNRTIIIQQITYELPTSNEEKAGKLRIKPIDPPGLRAYYDCRSDQGLLAIEWSCAVDHLDTAYMWFHMASTQEHQYQWEVQHGRIRQARNTIGTRHMGLAELDEALSYIPAQSFFVPSTSSSDSTISQDQDGIDDEDDEGNEIDEDDESNEIDEDEESNESDENGEITTNEHQPSKADDIVESSNQWIPSTKTFAVLSPELTNGNEYLPVGERLLTYKLEKEESSPYNISRISSDILLGSSNQCYSRLEKFLLFFDNAVSTINKKNPNWIIYLIYQQYQNDKGQTCYAAVGFVTVYLFYISVDKQRPRIGQISVLPPCQGKGHQRRLLTEIYNDLREDPRVQDIAAENPSNKFIALRDLVSLELCHKYLPNLFSNESILKINRLKKEMIDKARDICKLPKQQAQRVYEMYLLQSINKKDKEEMKHFFVHVQQRIFQSLQSKQTPNRNLVPDEIELMRDILIATEYKSLLKYYLQILEAYNKHHYN